MRLVFTDRGWEDYQWFQSSDRKLLKRVNALIKDSLRDPFDGIGKPERLKQDLTGLISRRIDEEHRLVYQVKDEDLIIVACRFHYGS
jgi:toxin YoeB